jgi:hypothetical protein
VLRKASWEKTSFRTQRRTSEQAGVRVVVLVLLSFLLGVALSALWFHRSPKPAPEPQPAIALSASTMSVLQRLESPVELRFYSVLDPESVPEPTRAFAGRVSELLSRYEQAANGKIKVTRFDSLSSSNANAALADGIKPFNLDKGEACYLGITVARPGAKESLASLSPEWEPALESDLTRAIARVTEVAPPAPAPKPDTSAVEAVKRAIPNLDSSSLDDATKMLREASVAEFAQAAQEMDAKLKEAQQRFLQAQTNQSVADQQAALKQLQQVQADQTEKLKQTAANAKAQLDALRQLKANPH